jgi:hypothetical protein
MAAAQGASLKELMERMGHSSPRAALIYQHATRDRDKKIAAGMGKLFKDATKDRSGTPREAWILEARKYQRIIFLTGEEECRAGDGNRTRMTSLEGW